MITTHFFYNIKPKKLFIKHKIKNKFPISSLNTVTYSKRSGDIIFSFQDHFDLHYSTELKDTILQYIFHAKEFLNRDETNLEFYFIDTEDLHMYCNHKNKKKSKSPPIEDAMVLNPDEFKIHFLGINENEGDLEDIGEDVVQENMSNNGVGLESFNFLQMLGIGGFSKLYLVQKRNTNELYALKSIRLPDKR